ncbi:MAG: hypothetical protein J1E80_05200 [Desulfovibrionaceae bacterium]|nr:hypothetical protein [Desulfovibrionaceae bacterium]
MRRKPRPHTPDAVWPGLVSCGIARKPGPAIGWLAGKAGQARAEAARYAVKLDGSAAGMVKA